MLGFHLPTMYESLVLALLGQVMVAGFALERGTLDERRMPPRGDPAQNSWFSPPKTWLTEPSVKIWRIELVSRSAQERTRTFSGALGGSGIVSVTTTCSSPAAPRFSHAAPENTPCVAAAYTRRAPASWTAWAAAFSVPAVSMMSSTRTAVFPSTSPIT